MKRRSKQKILSALAVLAILATGMLCADTAVAQCAMCRASFASNSTFAHYLNIGVAVLLIPPVSIFCTIFILAIKHRRSG